MSLRERTRQVVETRAFQHTITAVIIVNAATLGAETSASLTERFGPALTALDRTALGIFVLELLAKFYVYRLRFFRDPWNCFDFLVVGIALVPAAGGFSVLRALRVLRVLRLVSVIPSMRRVVATLLAAIPGATSIAGLLVLMVYVAGVMATKLFGEAVPEYFGNLGRSLWTLFQVMTGEAWPDIAARVMEHHPMAWIFFLVFILISTFVVLNLFLAVMVSAMETVRGQEADEPPAGAAGPSPTVPSQPSGAAVADPPAVPVSPAVPAGSAGHLTPAGSAGSAGGSGGPLTPAGAAGSAGSRPSDGPAVAAIPVPAVGQAAILAELTALRRDVAALRDQLERSQSG